MLSNVKGFYVTDQKIFDGLEAALSVERLAIYRNECGGNQAEAIWLIRSLALPSMVPCRLWKLHFAMLCRVGSLPYTERSGMIIAVLVLMTDVTH